MNPLALQQVSDFSDFTRGRDLSDFLRDNSIGSGTRAPPFHLRISPDGCHIHVVLSKPRADLMTCDKRRSSAQIRSQSGLVVSPAKRSPVADVVYLDRGRAGGGSALLVAFEDGTAEFWRFCEPDSGWHRLHGSDLCDTPGAKVVSVCAAGGRIVWCERRRPVENPSEENPPLLDGPRLCFTYSICSRAFELDQETVRLGRAEVVLRDGPPFVVVASAENVYLLPDSRASAPGSTSRLLLGWSPCRDQVAVYSICEGSILMAEPSAAAKGSDFRRLVSECLVALLAADPVELRSFSTTGDGGLVLLLSSGWICVMNVDGVLRRVHRLAENGATSNCDRISMNAYSDCLAVVEGRVLHVIDLQCGLELGRIPLRDDGILFLNHDERHVPHLLTDTGLFLVRLHESRSDHNPGQDSSRSVRLDSVLEEVVFEEACRRYQTRTLSGMQLTVDKMMSEGKLQAPILLSSVLRDYLKERTVSSWTQGGVHGCKKLLRILEPELKKLALLEDVKTSVLTASESQLRRHCEILVQEELVRLLRTELNGKDVLYLNVVFSSFPSESWEAVQTLLRLSETKDGALSSEAPAAVWRTVLAPVQPEDTSVLLTPLPIFELLCRLFLLFQPGQLPLFVDLAQQHAIGPSHSSSGSLIGLYGTEAESEGQPLYKRAISVLLGPGCSQDLEVELLLRSGRPNGVLQALRLLLDQGQWGQAVGLAERFCGRSPLLNKEIFTTLLRKGCQYRNLDPYLDRIRALCPEDMTASSIIRVVLESLSGSGSEPLPFRNRGDHLTVAPLRPLLAHVLQRETRPHYGYGDLTRFSAIPPPIPPRRPRGACQVAALRVQQEQL
ncbi:Hermansky-Pudlak syndrome 6 protein-like [Scleropages formosus]|uniref:Hermansky-Pudlak syndrome 6 protein-like n=1 Tax=Scleropages formosus TaxID=113540 RepID=UPI00087874B3|nr:Hermansky-Pudlak syndrome 6 protein-like [Scleropages formosus]